MTERHEHGHDAEQPTNHQTDEHQHASGSTPRSREERPRKDSPGGDPAATDRPESERSGLELVKREPVDTSQAREFANSAIVMIGTAMRTAAGVAV